MIKKFVYLFLFLSFAVNGQQTINKLITKELTVQDKVEVTSTTKSSKPCPVMTEVQRDAISSPATGSCVYNSNSLQLNVYDGTTWQEAGGGGISLWLTGLTYDVNDVVIESDRIYRCLIAHTSGTFSTDLANGNWTEVSGSIPVSLQDAYEDSSQPQITTNTSGLGVQFKRGTLNDTDVVVEVLNGAGASKFSVTGDGSVSTGSTITATGNITGANLSGTNTGDLTTGGDNDTPVKTATIVAPNKQLTLTGTDQYRLSTGNKDELQNSNFEHTTVTTGWTISNATASGNTANPLEGKKSLSLALTGALSLSQSSTINAAQKSGVQMVASIWVNSADVSDLQLCSLKNGAEDKCTVTGGYVQGSGWRQLTVSFLGDATSNGLKLKSTDTTGTVLVDQAYVGIGSPIVNLSIDPESISYTGYLSKSGSNVRFKTLSDNSSGNLITSDNATFTKYTALKRVIATACYAVNHAASRSDTQVVLYNSLGAVKKSWEGFYIQSGSTGGANAVCGTSIMEIGDYFSANESTATPIDANSTNFSITANALDVSKAYVASSSDTDWASCGHTTSDFTGFGTVSAIETQCKREGSDLLMRGKFTSGVSTAVEARINLKLNGLPLVSAKSPSIPSIQKAGEFAYSTNSASYGTTLIEPEVTYATFGIQSGSNAGLNKINANAITANGIIVTLNSRIPIQGWTDSGVIVGSFQGYNETPGTSRVETFSVSYGTTNATTACSASPCSYLDQIGNAVTSITRATTGDYTANFGKTYSKLKCNTQLLVGTTTAAFLAPYDGGLSCTNCNSMRIRTLNQALSGPADTNGTLLCQGIPQ